MLTIADTGIFFPTLFGLFIFITFLPLIPCLPVPTTCCVAGKLKIKPKVDCVWNVMAHGDARSEKWRGNNRMEWVTSKRHMTAEHRPVHAVQTLHADVRSSPASSRLNWPLPPTPLSADLNGLVRLAERRNLVSARVPSHFKRSLTSRMAWHVVFPHCRTFLYGSCHFELCSCCRNGAEL